MVETLVAGREAFDRHAWDEALEALTSADRAQALAGGDLELLAGAAWWSGHPDDSVEAQERAFAAYLEAGQESAAALVALRLGYLAFRRLAVSVATGWVGRAERLLAEEPESVAHAWLAVVHCVMALESGDIDAAITLADRAVELGRRHDSLDTQSLALSFKGSALIHRGQWKEGLALIDEAAAAAVAGELDIRTASDVYCITIAVCRNLADYRRAGEWTEEADRWMRREAVGGYPGVCRVHRAELKALRGSWSEAEQEARHACEELERFRILDAVGQAHYQVGEVRLHMGDLAEAGAAFNRAYEHGYEPQPGTALLLLAKGEIEAAARSITSALGGQPSPELSADLLSRTRLLPAQVEIALAAGDLDTARAATDELEMIAAKYESAALNASALSARGAVYHKEGRLGEAAGVLNRAWRLWQEIELPYESAKARMLFGLVRLASNDPAGRLDLRAARSTFTRLGAALDLRRVSELLSEDATELEDERRRLTKTFMFTDIVTSTDLVSLIGDAAWEDLLHWHDRTLRSAFAQHGGEEVRHTGDGFFVSFDRARDAVEAAVAIQRRLAEHRRQNGFAVSVRVGLHTAEATHQGNDYAGQGVHLAARVGGVGEAEEIVISSTGLNAAGDIRFPVSEPREVNLKGITDPVRVHSIDWR